MKIKNIQNNIYFDQIFTFLDNRKNFLTILNLQKDLKTTNIDINKYKKFFKYYDIVFYDINNNIQEIYHVNKIIIFKNQTEKFYDVYYAYKNLRTNSNHSSNMCIRKYLHLLDNNNAKLLMIKKGR